VDPATFYDALAAEYDLFVDWSARLACEMPFLLKWLERRNVSSVLDVACGTGHHALDLARRGYRVTGVDISQQMINRATELAGQETLDVRFERAALGELDARMPGPFEAILCLGNSLPHLVSEDALAKALQDLSRVLAPGGLILIQMRNFDRVLAESQRFMAPQTVRRGDEEWLFLRFYDMDGQRLRFNMVRLYRRSGGEWHWKTEETPLYAWRADQMRDAFENAGLQVLGTYGALTGEPYEPAASGDLVLVATTAT